MNRWLTILLIVAAGATTLGAEPAWLASLNPAERTELQKSTQFFLDQANLTVGSRGYGLVRDRWPGNPTLASIASTGFGLAALTVAVEAGWLDRRAAEVRVKGTFATLASLDRQWGFWYHFLDLRSGSPSPGSEVSSVDTMLLALGVLCAGQYFGGSLAAQAEALTEGIEWPRFVDKTNKQVFMAWDDSPMFHGHWDFYAEQLGLYVLGAGSKAHPMTGDEFYAFNRHYSTQEFINSWFGSIFTYQYSHAFIDFRGTVDKKRIDWFQNSVDASRSAWRFGKGVEWGYTASDSPHGYEGRYGSPPSGFDDTQHLVDGTLAPAGALGSAMFLPDEAAAAATYFASIPGLSGLYGFADAYNLTITPRWIDTDVIGIDKGITVLSLANKAGGLIWNTMNKVPTVIRGLAVVGVTRRKP